MVHGSLINGFAMLLQKLSACCDPSDRMHFAMRFLVAKPGPHAPWHPVQLDTAQ
jgi:hypothetical protein